MSMSNEPDSNFPPPIPPPPQQPGTGAPNNVPPPPGLSFGGFLAQGIPPSGPVTEQEKTLAIVAHALALAGLFTCVTFIGPLAIYLIKKEESPFVAAHCEAALYAFGALLGASVVVWLLGCLLSCVGVGPLIWFGILPLGLLYGAYCVWLMVVASRRELPAKLI
jgi:hypothetical protein